MTFQIYNTNAVFSCHISNYNKSIYKSQYFLHKYNFLKNSIKNQKYSTLFSNFILLSQKITSTNLIIFNSNAIILFINEELGMRSEELWCQLSLTDFKPLHHLRWSPSPFSGGFKWGFFTKFASINKGSPERGAGKP